MIEVREPYFHLKTDSTSYLFCVTESGYIEQIHYGASVELEDAEALRYKRTMFYGSQVMIDEKGEESLDNVPLNWSGSGRGDYRQPALELVFEDGSFTNDFVYKSYELIQGALPMEGLPTALAGDDTGVQSLMLTLEERVFPLRLQLIYTVFPKTNVISRRAVLINTGQDKVSVRRFMSFLLDLPDRNFRMLTLAGDWINETMLTERSVVAGIMVNQSTTGSSSNRHNPGVVLAERDANEDRGRVYGFNLLYSGNHYTAIEKSSRDLLRIVSGINPLNFYWDLSGGETFFSPEAVMTCSERGLNGLSHHFHDFINEHVVRGPWKKKERPVILNSWEANFFDFNEKKLLKSARSAKELGVELFVLDDGWFGSRNHDRAGLGDFSVNKNKLPSGLTGLSESIHKIGLQFGLWFEPESVNPDSELYRTHPEYAITAPGREALLGRHQLLLDLTRQDVRDYLVREISRILDSVKIDYVKWDMNRHMSEFYSESCPSGEFSHRYILGLYEILERIFKPRPQILLETCSSGGNRFDLGMLCYSPQIWASDNTDPIERLRIQKGLTVFYPLSSIGAHVSQAPHQQTLRNTPLSTRFNVAAFGAFGYELDLADLNRQERIDVFRQICFFKSYRRLFQFGKFYRSETIKANKVQWTCVDEEQNTAVTLFAQTLSCAGESNDYLAVKGLNARKRYHLKSVPQRIALRRFGHLIKHAMPIKIRAKNPLFSILDAKLQLDDGTFSVNASGAALETGIGLNNQFIGTGYHKDLRLWSDFGSQLYLIQLEDKQEQGESS